jgi:twinkle protein
MIIPTNIDFEQYLADVSILEAQEIHWANHWTDDLADLVKNGHRITGHKLPWAKTHECFRLRSGELTIWAGVNGHRKSMLVGQVMTWIARHSKVCIASLEMKPRETLLRMCQQAAGCFPGVDFAREFSEWGENRICIYDQLDTVEAVRILGMVRYAAMELGCKHVVIDSLTKCGLAEEDYAAEKKFLDRLQWTAKRCNVHVHLICHMRKGISEDRVPNKFDIKGSGAITDLADNVVVCWKDKRKEEAKKKRMANQTLSEEEQESLTRPDQKMIIEKQRHGSWEGTFLLWFDDPSLQFIPSEATGPMPFAMKEKTKIHAPGWEIYAGEMI